MHVTIFPPQLQGTTGWDARAVRRFLEQLAEARTGVSAACSEPGSAPDLSSPGLARSSEPGPTASRSWSTPTSRAAPRRSDRRPVRWLAAALVSPCAALLGDRYDRRLVMVGIGSAPGRAHRRGGSGGVCRCGAHRRLRARRLVSVAANPFPSGRGRATHLARPNTPEELSAANVFAARSRASGSSSGRRSAVFCSRRRTREPSSLATAVLVVCIGGADPGDPARSAMSERRSGRAESGRDELLAGSRTILSDRKVAPARRTVLRSDVRRRAAGRTDCRGRALVPRRGACSSRLAERRVRDRRPGGRVLAGALVGRGRLAADFGLGVLLFGLPLALVSRPGETRASRSSC